MHLSSVEMNDNNFLSNQNYSLEDLCYVSSGGSRISQAGGGGGGRQT